MTGGAVGSLIAQFFHLTSAERKTLLVAGAAAGMSATFASPLAAVLLAVEYAVDPLEILFVREVMRRDVVALGGDASAEDVAAARPQRLYPVVDGDGCLLGVVRRSR